MGFSAGVGFLVDTDGNGTNDGKVVTLKKGSNITLSLTGSTLTIASTGGGGGSAITIQDEGSSLSTAAETIDFVGAGVTATGTGTTKTITIPGTDTNTFRTVTAGGNTLGGSETLAFTAGTGISISEDAGAVTITNSVTDTNTQLSQERVEDYVGGMLDGTETFIDVSYDDTDGNIDFVVPVKDEDNMASNSATHLATQQSIKAYVDSVASGLDVKDSVRVATTANITLSNQQTIDGVSVVAGNRVLVKDQSTASENGIYLCVDGGSWTRATDLAASDTAAGFFTFVEEGTANADIGYVCTSNAGADTVGTHSLAFAQFSAPGQVTAGTGIDKAGSEISVDVSDFMATGADHRVLTATGTDAFEGEANLTFDGSTLNIVGGLSLGAAAELTITESSDDITIKNTVSNKDIIFNVNDGGSDTEVLRIDGGESSVRIGQSTSNAADGPDAKLDIRGPNDNTISVRASGTISVENSVEVTSPSSRAYSFLSISNNDSMVGGNLRLDDSVSGGTHDGYASGTDLRGGSGIKFTNTTSDGSDGEIIFLRQNDSADNTWTVKESMRIDENGNVGIGTSSPAVDLEITDTTTSSATQGGGLRLSSNDGALMASGHRLGVIEFAGAEDGSSTMTVGARIEVLCDGAWSGSANAANMVFYTTTGNATQGEVMRLNNDKSITTQGGITVQTGASSGQKALYLRHQEVDEYAVSIAADNTIANVVDIDANDVTTATVLDIDSGGAGTMTTGKVIDGKGTYTIADGGTVTSNRLYTTLVGTATQTNIGALSYVKKTGITASGKTSTITAFEAWANDAETNNASGTSIARGIHSKATASSAQGTTSTFGGIFEVSGADNNYGVQIIGGSLLLGTLSAAPADISTYGQLWVKDEGEGNANTELYFTNDNGDDIRLTFGGASRRVITAGGNTLDQTETLAFTAGSNISISESGGAVTIAATGTISGGITVQEEGSSLSTLGDTLNFVGSSVTASGTGTTKTITISGGGAFALSSNIIKTTETIGIGGSNAQEFALTDGGALNSEAIMTNGGTNASVVTKGMGFRKNLTIVVPDADQAADANPDTYTVAPTDHNILICNINPSDGAQNAAQRIQVVQLPAISTTYVGREITITLHAHSGGQAAIDNINVKPAGDDVILYHGRMWDNNQTVGDHSRVGSALGGLGMTMGHAALTDVHWAAMGQISVISVTMVAVDHGRLSALLGGSNPPVSTSDDARAWNDGVDLMTSDVWLVTQVSGLNTVTDTHGIGQVLLNTVTGASNHVARSN